MLLGHKKELDFLKTLATEGRLGHGYIFFGADGVGKRKVAEELCGFLESESSITSPKPLPAGRQVSLNKERDTRILQDSRFIIHDSSGSIGIDAVRAARMWLSLKPATSSRRTLVIDEAEKMAGEAQNALLKIAEDPPGAGLIILITRDPELLQFTLASRFQDIYFAPVPKEDILVWLKKEHGVPEEKARRATERSFGRPGLAYRLCFDEALRGVLENAEKFLAGSFSYGGGVKQLVADEAFDLERFLEAVILVLSWRGREKISARVWHDVVSLREQASRFNLNPRIQLEALATMI